jgi:hypothetical protein
MKATGPVQKRMYPAAASSDLVSPLGKDSRACVRICIEYSATDLDQDKEVMAAFISVSIIHL